MGQKVHGHVCLSALARLTPGALDAGAAYKQCCYHLSGLEAKGERASLAAKLQAPLMLGTGGASIKRIMGHLLELLARMF